MPEPDWKQELRWMAEAFAATDFQGHSVAPSEIQGAVSRYLLATGEPHIEAAYVRGLVAGRSQQGYATRRKKKEEQCSPTAAPSAGPPSPASSTEEDG